MKGWDLGRSVKALRRRQGLTQAQVAAQIGCSHDVISRIENDRCDGIPAGRLRDCVAALGGYLSVEVRWQGERLPRLLDARHAALQNHTAARLAAWGWLVRPEVSFNHYGDRGRIDLLAFHEPMGLAVVSEIKPALGGVQDTLGRLDVKVRLGAQIANRFGWVAAACVPLLVLGEGTTQRRQVARHEALFGSLLTGRAALAWLQTPSRPVPAGLLLFAVADSPSADAIGSDAGSADRIGRW